MSLNVSAIFPAIPGQFMGSRTEKSPLLSVFSAVRRVPEWISSVGEAGRVAMFHTPQWHDCTCCSVDAPGEKQETLGKSGAMRGTTRAGRRARFLAKMGVIEPRVVSV